MYSPLLVLQVRAAKMNAGRAKQLEEKRQMRQNTLQYDLALDEITVRNYHKAVATEAEKQAAKKEKNIQARKYLESQMEVRPWAFVSKAS